MKSLKQSLLELLNEDIYDAKGSVLQSILNDYEEDHLAASKDFEEVGQKIVTACHSPEALKVFYKSSYFREITPTKEKELKEIINTYGWLCLSASLSIKDEDVNIDEILDFTDFSNPKLMTLVKRSAINKNISRSDLASYGIDVSPENIKKLIDNAINNNKYKDIFNVIAKYWNDFSRKVFKKPWDVIS